MREKRCCYVQLHGFKIQIFIHIIARVLKKESCAFSDNNRVEKCKMINVKENNNSILILVSPYLLPAKTKKNRSACYHKT